MRKKTTGAYTKCRQFSQCTADELLDKTVKNKDNLYSLEGQYNTTNGATYILINGKACCKIETRNYPRHRRQCVIEYPTNRNPAQYLQETPITAALEPRL